MVIYCCVKGCNSNGNDKKKNPNSMISFHAFPRNEELKSKWAKAIGRPNWNPSAHARICNMHFSNDHINFEGCRIRIKEDAIPTMNLPLNSNFEATNVEACRICLATDLNLHSLQDTHLGNCMDSITGFNRTCNIEGLPQYVCYQCAPILIKFYKFVEKGMIAQATLLDIFAKNGEITSDLIKKEDRQKLNLISSLKCSRSENYYHFEDGDDITIPNTNPLINTDNDIIKQEEIDLPVDVLFIEDISDNIKIENETQDLEVTDISNTLKEDITSDDNTNEDDDSMNASLNDTDTSDDEIDLDEEIKQKKPVTLDKLKKKKLKTKKQLEETKLVEITISDVPIDDANLETFFSVIELSPEEQMEEWKKAPLKIPMNSEGIFECEVCYKLFPQHNTYRAHIGSHDPSRGEFECPICKIRFKTAVLVKSHVNHVHSKKYYCKACPKSFSNDRIAKQHQRWHLGYRYTCKLCPYKSAHESALCVHVRRAHAHKLACAACGRACASRRALHHHVRAAHTLVQEADLKKTYPCEECNINFASEGARRVHLLTSKQHKKTSDVVMRLDKDLQNICKRCGVQHTSRSELVAHMRAEHPRPKQKCRPRDEYPTKCQFCEETMTTRQQHAQHVRWKHPKEMDLYCPVTPVTCVCDICGQGFQNTTKLELHKLRHGAPMVRCPLCPRLFYDKYAVARHATTHSANKTHVCRTCGKAFRHPTNLDRHCKSVHSDATPFECTMCGRRFKYSSSMKLHVRSVHYKIPLPPRNRKSKATKVVNEVLS